MELILDAFKAIWHNILIILKQIYSTLINIQGDALPTTAILMAQLPFMLIFNLNIMEDKLDIYVALMVSLSK